MGVFERPAERNGVKHLSGGIPGGEGAAPKNIVAPTKMRLILKPFGMHGIVGDRVHLVQGFGLHLAACLVRFREWTVIDRPNAAVPVQISESVPQYCIESTAYQA